MGVGVRVNEVGWWWMDAQRSTDTVTQRFKSTDLDRGRCITYVVSLNVNTTHTRERVRVKVSD